MVSIRLRQPRTLTHSKLSSFSNLAKLEDDIQFPTSLPVPGDIIFNIWSSFHLIAHQLSQLAILTGEKHQGLFSAFSVTPWLLLPIADHERRAQVQEP